MNERWAAVAERAVAALGVRAGELVQVRDRTGRYDVVQEMLLAIERRGATPLPELLPPDYLERLLATTDPSILANWDRRRSVVMQQHDRALVLAGMDANLALAPSAAVAAWRQAVHRLTLVEERRQVPYLLVAVPTPARAESLGTSLADLEDVVVPALAADPAKLRREIDRVLDATRGGQVLTIRSGDDCTLRLTLGDRRWLSDAGEPAGETESVASPQTVQNLPAGAVYITVVEEATSGSLWLPRAGDAHDVTLCFAHGRVASIEASRGADALAATFDSHSGEPRRVSHVGIGLNPCLEKSIGWTLVDEHAHGSLLIAFGENRYLGGQNESSLNVDYAIPNATLDVDDRVIVRNGRLAV